MSHPASGAGTGHRPERLAGPEKRQRQVPKGDWLARESIEGPAFPETHLGLVGVCLRSYRRVRTPLRTSAVCVIGDDGNRVATFVPILVHYLQGSVCTYCGQVWASSYLRSLASKRHARSNVNICPEHCTNPRHNVRNRTRSSGEWVFADEELTVV